MLSLINSKSVGLIDDPYLYKFLWISAPFLCNSKVSSILQERPAYAGMIHHVWLSTKFIYVVVIVHVVLGAVGEPCASCMDVHFNDLGLNDSFYVSLI